MPHQKFMCKKLEADGSVVRAWLNCIGEVTVEDMTNDTKKSEAEKTSPQVSPAVVMRLSISEANKQFTKEQLRQIMPQTAQWYDQFKEQFPGCKLVYACEGGLEIGVKSPQGVIPCIDERNIPKEETMADKIAKYKAEKDRRRKR